MTEDFAPGPRNLITDVAGLRVGNAQDKRLKSGVTVLTADAPFTAGVDVRGGAPGTRDIALLAPDKTVAQVDALVLSGGSAFGLSAADGVLAGLRARGRGFAVGPARVPIVPAAILFDLINGGDKDWGDTPPYPALGRAALDAAAEDFALGSEGAGAGALTAHYKGGLGSASARVAGRYTVGALVAANPVGCALVPGSRHFWAGPWEQGGEFGALGPHSGPAPALGPRDTKLGAGLAEGASTTLAIVATDAVLDKAGATRFATAAQDGLARALSPAHTPYDGDLVFAAATGAVPVADPVLDPMLLGHAAALALARAIARAVYHATPAPGDTRPAYRS